MAFEYLPKERQLDSEMHKEIGMLLSLRANKKMVQQYAKSKVGKVITLRDLSNIRRSCIQRDNSLPTVVNNLKSEGAVVDVVVSSDSNALVGIYYQDRNMLQMMDMYPDFVMLDSTYKLNDLRMPLYVFLVVDGNGSSEVVATFLAVDETRETVTRMVELFKLHNPSHTKIQSVMTDKDFVERIVLRTELPNANLVICLFHVLKSFKNEVMCEKMGINSAQREVCLSLFQDICYSRNATAFDKNVRRLRQTGFWSVVKYFERNWLPIKEEFVEGCKAMHLTLNNSTNNRLESINQKIKTVCRRLAKFILYESMISGSIIAMNIVIGCM